MTNTAPDFRLAVSTQKLIDLMVERLDQPNALITFYEIEEVTGRRADAARGLFYTARRHVRRDHKRWYANDHGLGYRLMADENLPDCGKQNRRKARTLHRETIRILSVANVAMQTPAAQSRTIMERSIAELGLAATAPLAVRKVEQMVARSHNELTSEQQVSAIKDALGGRR